MEVFDIFLLEAVLNGILLGGLLALLSLGLNLIFGVIDVVWICYAEMIMVGDRPRCVSHSANVSSQSVRIESATRKAALLIFVVKTVGQSSAAIVKNRSAGVGSSAPSGLTALTWKRWPIFFQRASLSSSATCCSWRSNARTVCVGVSAW